MLATVVVHLPKTLRISEDPGCLTQVLNALKMRCLGSEAYSPWVGAGELSRRGFWANGPHEKSGVSRDVSGSQTTSFYRADTKLR